ncbi:MAG: cation transporter [Candidatus Moranbacteria bacterium]|jgi:cation diffusion facilitator family transporter|nr:cation transporter [Candidatus Moranbacteria bacterium]
MSVLSLAFVRNGHFFWCPGERTLGHHECKRCLWQLYAFVSVLALVVAVLEFVGSSHTGSQALWGDAWHVLSDALGYLIGFVDAYLSGSILRTVKAKKQIRDIGEYLIGSTLLLSGIGIITNSVLRLWSDSLPQLEQGGTLSIVALVGLLANILILWLLWGFGHQHDHHGHGHGENHILTGNIWHTIGDTSASFLVLTEGLLLWLTSAHWVRYLDVVGATLIALMLMWQGFKIFVRHWQEECSI